MATTTAEDITSTTTTAATMVNTAPAGSTITIMVAAADHQTVLQVVVHCLHHHRVYKNHQRNPLTITITAKEGNSPAHIYTVVMFLLILV